MRYICFIATAILLGSCVLNDTPQTARAPEPAPLFHQQTDQEWAQKEFTDLSIDIGHQYKVQELLPDNRYSLREFYHSNSGMFNNHQREVMATFLKEKFNAISVLALDEGEIFVVISNNAAPETYLIGPAKK